MMTPTPWGWSTFHRASAICPVSRSWTWSRRAKTSTIRGTLDSPRIRPLGMYATCTLPKNGSMWCSHMEYTSMSFTITMSW